MKTILISGGVGFIGSNFIRYALKAYPDWQIVNFDKLTYAGNLANLTDVEDHARYRFVHGDIADRSLITQLFRHEESKKFDVVVNFAAESHVDRSIFDATPFIETNVKGTQVLLEAAREYQVERFVQISTDEVYGSIIDGRFTEESPLQPNSAYAASKAAADLLCRAYHKTYGLPVIITRSSNNYGPYQFPEKLVPLMIWNALTSKTLPVYGEGKNVRDWLYVEDNCRAIALVLQKGRVGEVYNIGGSEERRNFEIVKMICELMSERLRKPLSELEALIAFVKDRPGHDYRYALDSTKITNELSWKPSMGLEEGLARTIDWYLQNQEWVRQVVSGEYQEYYARVYERGWSS
jgi:dTDP-glucose 4,6-dehydratase